MKKKGARILVMDDEPEMVRLLERTFIAHDFQVWPIGVILTKRYDVPYNCEKSRS